MRFFRIPSFTGIETHRDDADRGSLRVVEGCLPHGPGGVRSGPVWEEVGSVDLFSDNSKNILTANDDGKGNSVVVASRGGEVHDMVIFSTENTAVVSLGSSYMVADSEAHTTDFATITPVGNRMHSFGDGSAESVFFGKGPAGTQPVVFPDQELYTQEWSRFPNCQFFVQGPKKTLFGAGNPNSPLTVYISESAGMTKEYRDSPYSTEMTNQIPGRLSTVNILSSDATRITALSTRGDQVVVHTDKGCHLLYAPGPDQASTGYRVEQVPTTNFSAAVNQQVVAGESGSQNFWLGFDGQIYKDESAARGAEDKKNYADGSQATWKSKGLWEAEQLQNLNKSFSTYDPQSGTYWVFLETPTYLDFYSKDAPKQPLGLTLDFKADAPDAPESLEIAAITPSNPNPISGFSMVAIPDAPEIPEDLIISDFQVDAPNSPESLDMVVVKPVPNPPESLSLTSIPDSPSVPESLVVSGIPDAPNAPEFLGVVLLPDAPNAPESLTVVQNAPLLNPIGISAGELAPELSPEQITANQLTSELVPTGLTANEIEPALSPESITAQELAPLASPGALTAGPGDYSAPTVIIERADWYESDELDYDTTAQYTYILKLKVRRNDNSEIFHNDNRLAFKVVPGVKTKEQMDEYSAGIVYPHISVPESPGANRDYDAWTYLKFSNVFEDGNLTVIAILDQADSKFGEATHYGAWSDPAYIKANRGLVAPSLSPLNMTALELVDTPDVPALVPSGFKVDTTTPYPLINDGASFTVLEDGKWRITLRFLSNPKEFPNAFQSIRLQWIPRNDPNWFNIFNDDDAVDETVETGFFNSYFHSFVIDPLSADENGLAYISLLTRAVNTLEDNYWWDSWSHNKNGTEDRFTQIMVHVLDVPESTPTLSPFNLQSVDVSPPTISPNNLTAEKDASEFIWTQSAIENYEDANLIGDGVFGSDTDLMFHYGLYLIDYNSTNSNGTNHQFHTTGFVNGRSHPMLTYEDAFQNCPTQFEDDLRSTYSNATGKRMGWAFPDLPLLHKGAQACKVATTWTTHPDIKSYTVWVPLKYGGRRNLNDFQRVDNQDLYLWSNPPLGTQHSWYLRSTDSNYPNVIWLVYDPQSENYVVISGNTPQMAWLEQSFLYTRMEKSAAQVYDQQMQTHNPFGCYSFHWARNGDFHTKIVAHVAGPEIRNASSSAITSAGWYDIRYYQNADIRVKYNIPNLTIDNVDKTFIECQSGDGNIVGVTA